MAGGFTANLQVELELGKSRTIQQFLGSLLRSQIWPELVRALFLMEKMYRKFVSFTRYHPFPHVDSFRISPILDAFVEHRIGQKTKKLGGEGPWSFQSIREFLRNIIFLGLWALPGQIGGSIFVGAKTGCPKKYANPWKRIHDFEISLPENHQRLDENWICPFEWSKLKFCFEESGSDELVHWAQDQKPNRFLRWLKRVLPLVSSQWPSKSIKIIKLFKIY